MSTITSKLRQLVGANGEIGPVQATWNGAVVAESDRTEGRGQPLLPARRREERPARSHPRGLQPRPAAPAPGQPGGCAPAASRGRMRARGKPHDLTVVACARELACFLWAAATAD